MECVLALTLGVIVLAPVTMAFKVSLSGWEETYKHDELLNHARMAMARMVSDLRYAVTILQADSATHSYLEFTTRNLLDDTWDAETLMFYRTNGNPVLYRRVVEGEGAHLIGSKLAGLNTTEGIIQVDAFEITPLKKATSGDPILLDTSGGDTLDMTVAVQMALTMSDTESGDSVTVTSVAKLRNR